MASPSGGEHPTRVTFPPAAWAAFGILAVLMLGWAGVAMKVFLDQRERIIAQDRKQSELLRRMTPVLHDLQPLVSAARDQLPQTRRSLRRADDLVRETDPLVEGLRSAQLPSVVRRAGAALDALTRGPDLPAVLARMSQLVETIDRTDLVEGTVRTQELTREALAELRERRALDRLLRAVDDIPRLLALQRELISLQRRALGTLETSLEVQRETERHAESLDRKTGGPVAPVGGRRGVRPPTSVGAGR